MQSNGGTVPLDAVASRPVDLMLSGPAAVSGALRRSTGSPHDGRERALVSMEIGGTSCDVAVMTGGSLAVLEHLELGGYHLRVASVDVHSVGAGGGTLARVDGGTLLRVGPEGAGAEPGPACYGRGGSEPTATDAHVVLGRLAPGPAAGGVLDLDAERARRAVTQHVADPLDLEPEAAAIGIITVLETHLRQAVETNTVERGRDPTVMTLVAAGGAGGLHGSPVARALGCRRLVIPADAGVFCAVGMLHAPLRRDRSRSVLGDLEELAPGRLGAALDAEVEALVALVAAEWPTGVEPTIERHVELRYPGQLWSVRVPVTDIDLAAAVGPSAAVDAAGAVGRSAAVDAAGGVDAAAAVDAAGAVGPSAAVDAAAAVGPSAAVDAAAAVGPSAAVDAAAAVGPSAAVDAAAAVGPSAAVDAAAAVGPSAAVDAAAVVRDRFESTYRGLYGHIQPGGRLEVTGVGAVATGPVDDPPSPSAPTVTPHPADPGRHPPMLARRRPRLGRRAGARRRRPPAPVRPSRGPT